MMGYFFWSKMYNLGLNRPINQIVLSRKLYSTQYQEPIPSAMRTIYSNYCDQYFERLTDITNRTEAKIKKAEKIIALTIRSLQELKTLVLENEFSEPKEEIYFFKILKPKVFSQLIYYTKVKQVETTLPYYGYIKEKKKHLANELQIIGLFFQRNLDFCHYMHNNFSHWDDKYFIRGQKNCHIFDDTFQSITDEVFSTCFDYKAACLLAYDRLTIYFKNKIKNIHQQEDDSFIINEPPPFLQWTGTKIALVELIYALQASGCINNGNASIKDVKETFEKIFEIELDDCYRLFLEIKTRSNSTKFMDKLSEDLIRKIETQDR